MRRAKMRDVLARLAAGLSLCCVLGASAGCATLKAMTNPKAATAMGEGAGMGVVVRRAEAAIEVSSQVDRLLALTPLDDDSEWLATVKLNQERAAKAMDEASKHGCYANAQTRILPVEAWAAVLTGIKSGTGKHPSLLAMISAEAAADYRTVQQKGKAFADAEAKVGEAKAKLDQEEDKLDAAAKDARKAEIDKLGQDADKAEEEFRSAKDALIEKLKAACAKTEPAVRDKIGGVVLALRQAIDDAKTANGSAMVRYPLAAVGITGDVQSQAGVFCADYIEEKTGTRPDMRGIQPGVTMDGLTPSITLNGLGKEQLGQLSLSEVTSETASRTQRWMGKATTLMGWASGTAAYLGYQADVLDAILEGFESAGWKRPEVVDIEAKGPPEAEPTK